MLTHKFIICSGFELCRHGVTLKDAFSFVQSKRFCCNPNEGFMAQLREYEPIYKAMHTVPLPLPGDAPQRLSMKRGLEYEDTDPNTSTVPSVMDTSASFQFGANSQTGNGNAAAPFSSTESSSSESLRHHHAEAQSTDSPML